MKVLAQAHRLLFGLLVLLVAGCAPAHPATGNLAPAPTLAASPTANVIASTTTPAITKPARTTSSGLATILVNSLPREARITLTLIAQGGPFPYDRDGVVFQNRERILPSKTSNYYHEYTVPTPGEYDRGARRIIVGQQGEIYYTADHYQSFVEVMQ